MFINYRSRVHPESRWQVRPYVLISLDGWGVAPPSRGNAIYLAKTPNYDFLLQNYPHTTLIASGESVGLPANEVGNSEVGHLTMGVGRVILQSLERINLAIQDESFYQNPALLAAVQHAQQHHSRLHIMGLVGSGNVHSSYQHLEALLTLCQKQAFPNVVLHLFTDGRDAPPQDGIKVVAALEQRLAKLGWGQIVTVAGRYYAMDRDARWERIKLAYEAMVLGRGEQFASASQAMQTMYARGKTDEFVVPLVIVKPGQPPLSIFDNDAVIFINFRVDRARELTMALTVPDFEHLPMQQYGFDPRQAIGQTAGVATFLREKRPKNLFMVTMTEYQEGLPVAAVAYRPEKQLINSVGELIAKKGWRQLRLAESEKERMVTYYFNGMHSRAFPGEEAMIVSSPKVSTYDHKPEMSAKAIVNEFKKALKKDLYHFLMLNFANPDMVAHTGNLEATIKGVEATDKAFGEVVHETLKHDGVVFITADHGNSEELITFPTDSFFFTSNMGTVNTDHSNNPVPLLVIANQWYNRPVELPKGVMSDLAPTMLFFMGIPKPPEMIGRNLAEGMGGG